MSPALEAVFAEVRRAELPEFMDVKIDNPFVRCPWNGESLLHVIAIWGDLKSAKILLESGLEVDLLGEDDFTPLHHAVAQGHPELVTLFLSHGADPSRICLLGDAFEMAQRRDNSDITAILDAYKNATVLKVAAK